MYERTFPGTLGRARTCAGPPRRPRPDVQARRRRIRSARASVAQPQIGRPSGSASTKIPPLRAESRPPRGRVPLAMNFFRTTDDRQSARDLPAADRRAHRLDRRSAFRRAAGLRGPEETPGPSRRPHRVSARHHDARQGGFARPPPPSPFLLGRLTALRARARAAGADTTRSSRCASRRRRARGGRARPATRCTRTRGGSRRWTSVTSLCRSCCACCRRTAPTACGASSTVRRAARAHEDARRPQARPTYTARVKREQAPRPAP